MSHPIVTQTLEQALQNATLALSGAEQRLKRANAELQAALHHRDNMIRACTALRCSIAREKAILERKDENQ